MYQASDQRYDKMTFHRTGRSGLKLPAVSLGLWHNFGHTGSLSTMTEICETAFDHGVTHFDLANNYGPPAGSAEENFGRILQGSLAPYRDELVISSKAGYGMWDGPYGDWGSRKYLIASLDQSLKRMGLEYVDIFYHHRPDPDTPLEETMTALADIVRSGKALYVGLSNYSGDEAAQAAAILRDLGTPLLINQNRYNMLDRRIEENGLKSWSADNGVGIIAFSPLNQGILTGRYLDGIPEDSRVHTDGRFLKATQITDDLRDQIRGLSEIASNRGQSLAQMALSWILRDGEVTSVLVGVSKPEQLLDNLQIVGASAFTADELRAIDALIR